MHDIQWHPSAAREFQEAGSYLEQQEKGLGGRYAKYIENAVFDAAETPTRFQRVEAGCQIVRAKVFPYSVIYQERDDLIRIIAIMHQHRKPGYWKERSENRPNR